MGGHHYRLRPWADRTTRAAALLEIRQLIQSGRYHVPADQVADAFLAEACRDSSSCGGSDADAKQRWKRPKP